MMIGDILDIHDSTFEVAGFCFPQPRQRADTDNTIVLARVHGLSGIEAIPGACGTSCTLTPCLAARSIDIATAIGQPKSLALANRPEP
jgi:hypothetical protein